MNRAEPPAASRQITLFVIVTALYYVCGKLGLNFGYLHPIASAIWPPTGLAIAVLVLFGYRLWPAIFVGALLVNATTFISVPTALAIAVGNTLEALIAFYLIERFAGGRAVFNRAPDIMKFAASVMLSSAVSASVGVSALWLGGYLDASVLVGVWSTWWFGDVGGAMVVAPLLVLWWTDYLWRHGPKQLIEALVLLSVIGFISGVVFFEPELARYPFAFLCLPPLAWAALRFGQREVATAIAVQAVIATVATVLGSGPFVLLDANDSLLVLQAFVITLSVTGLPLAALMSERNALLQRERAALASANAANRSKDQFISMLSHELRNPLNAISMAVFIMQQSKIDAETTRWADAIHRQTEVLTRIIDDLLEAARVTTGKVMLTRRPVNVGETTARCLRVLSTAGKFDQHKLETRTDSVWINGDPMRIEQIVNNLLHNAIKFTPAGGTIRVRTYGEKGNVCIRVEDTGIGIAPELLPRVFDLFTQGDQGLDRAQGGLGVGLALVRRLVELHHGTIEVESGDQGSTFIVRLPRIEPPAISPTKVLAVEELNNEKRAVLIVEDNDDSRRALRSVLELAGHDVDEAENGRAAIEAARTRRPDVALVDIGLPGIDGYELALRLRKEHENLRLIAVTGYGRQQDRERANAAGFDAHLVKPVDPERLAAVIDDVCRDRRGAPVL